MSERVPNAPFFEKSVPIPGGAAAKSQHIVEVPRPRGGVPIQDTMVTLHNPGSVKVNVEFQNRNLMAGVWRFPLKGRAAIGPGSTEGTRVTDWPTGEGDARIIFLPDVAVPAGPGFTLDVEVRRI
jgi:hypothetical protein